MTRPRSEKADEAFQIWCSTGEQSDRKTAEITGVPLSTVGYYRREYQWSERWQEIVGPEAQIASNQGREMLKLATPLGARRLIRIIGGVRPLRNLEGQIVRDEDGAVVYVDEADHKDAIQALKLLLAYNWGDPRNSTYDPEAERLAGLPAYTVREDGQTEQALPESDEDLAAIKAGVQAMIEATVQGVNTRTKFGKRV
jgi:hypothetical protein